MTVDELIAKLAPLPGDMKVVVSDLDPYGEYLVYNEVTALSFGQHSWERLLVGSSSSPQIIPTK